MIYASDGMMAVKSYDLIVASCEDDYFFAEDEKIIHIVTDDDVDDDKQRAMNDSEKWLRLKAD